MTSYRLLTIEDAESLRALYDDPKIAYFAATVPLDPSLDWARERIVSRNTREQSENGQEYGLFVQPHDGEEVLVATALWFWSNNGMPEIGYCVHRDWRGNGIARQALRWILGTVQDRFGLHQIITATVAEENIASLHILESAGFKQHGRHISNNLSRPNEGIPCYIYLLDPANRANPPGGSRP